MLLIPTVQSVSVHYALHVSINVVLLIYTWFCCFRLVCLFVATVWIVDHVFGHDLFYVRQVWVFFLLLEFVWIFPSEMYQSMYIQLLYLSIHPLSIPTSFLDRIMGSWYTFLIVWFIFAHNAWFFYTQLSSVFGY